MAFALLHLRPHHIQSVIRNEFIFSVITAAYLSPESHRVHGSLIYHFPSFIVVYLKFTPENYSQICPRGFPRLLQSLKQTDRCIQHRILFQLIPPFQINYGSYLLSGATGWCTNF